MRVDEYVFSETANGDKDPPLTVMSLISKLSTGTFEVKVRSILLLLVTEPLITERDAIVIDGEELSKLNVNSDVSRLELFAKSSYNPGNTCMIKDPSESGENVAE